MLRTQGHEGSVGLLACFCIEFRREVDEANARSCGSLARDWSGASLATAPLILLSRRGSGAHFPPRRPMRAFAPTSGLPTSDTAATARRNARGLLNRIKLGQNFEVIPCSASATEASDVPVHIVISRSARALRLL